MTTSAVIAAPPAPPSPAPPRRLPIRVLAWALIAVQLALPVAALFLGARQETYVELRRAVASGEVSSVVVSGGTTQPFRGRQQVEVRWREHGILHYAEAVEQHPLRRDRLNGLQVVSDVGEDLRGLDPGVQVDRRPHDDLVSGASIATLPHWRFPGWLGLAWLGSLLLTVGVVIGGPVPWRATRWAWFWIVGGLPLAGPLAYLLLGGATGCWAPRTRRRLTGGIAFVLVVAVNTLVI